MLPEIERFQRWLRRKAPQASTPKHYGNDLELFFAWLQKLPDEVRVTDVDNFIEHCQQRRLNAHHDQPAASRPTLILSLSHS